MLANVVDRPVTDDGAAPIFVVGNQVPFYAVVGDGFQHMVLVFFEQDVHDFQAFFTVLPVQFLLCGKVVLVVCQTAIADGQNQVFSFIGVERYGSIEYVREGERRERLTRLQALVFGINFLERFPA